MNTFAIVGAGGFGREVMPVAREMLERAKSAQQYEVVFVDRMPGVRRINGHRVLSDEAFLELPGPRYFNVAIADYGLRRSICSRYTSAGAKPFSVIAATSIVMDEAEIGEGALICPFAFIGPNVRIGKFFHANIFSYVAHDCVLGDFVTLAPRVNLNGGIRVEDDAYIGTGAVFRQATGKRPMQIGRAAIVGMGAVVVESVASGITVVGNPARPLNRKS